MNRIITIATSDYFPYTRRLFISLLKTNKDFEFYIFCDSREPFIPLIRLGRCKIIELPEIKKIGVKRAKFKAFYEMTKHSDFLYLDSDIFVLDSIDELFHKKNIVGCFDDLSGCDFIPNKEFPWKDQTITNRTYINSGVFFAPRSEHQFFKEIYHRSLSDEDWDTYTIPNKLLDNHFLCAMFNIYNQKVVYVDETIYNWQGFIQHGELQVYRKENHLLNIRSQKKIKLIHFAGIPQVDDFLISLPIDISSLLADVITLIDPLHEEGALSYLACLSKSLEKYMEDVTIPKIAHDLLDEMEEFRRTEFKKDYAAVDSYFHDRSAIVSWAYSKPASPFKWNGLFHGGPYLTGDEYAFLRKLIHDQNIQSVLEIGAGETSILFNQHVKTSYSIEPSFGPWLERAKASGCQVYQIDFLPDELHFSEKQMSDLFEKLNLTKIDLFFLDSPVGTESRSKIIEQISAFADIKYILVHDAYRDSRNIFYFQQSLGLNQLDYFPSERGLVLLGKSTIRLDTSHRMLPVIDLLVKDPDYSLQFMENDKHLLSRSRIKIPIKLENKSSFAFSSKYEFPIYVAYHWLDPNEQILLYDGIRTELPFQLFPDDTGEFSIDVVTPNEDGLYILQVDLLQEGVTWFESTNPALRFTREFLVTTNIF